MGKFKEANSTVYSATASNYSSDFERPTYIGLIEIIKNWGMLGDEASDLTRDYKELSKGSEYFSDEQLCF